MQTRFNSDVTEEAYWLGYLAGIIDGEGSIGLYKHKDNKGNVLYYTKVSMGMRNLSVLEFLQKRYGGKVRSRHKEGESPMYDLYFESVPSIKLLLSQLRLIAKQSQADLLLEACKYIGYKGGRPVWVEPKLDELTKKIKELKKVWV